MKLRILLLLCAWFATSIVHAQTARRRALLIGINDYTASKLGAKRDLAQRDWPSLRGAVNDVRTLQEMLTLVHGFAPADILTLTDQNATRATILSAIEEHLVKPSNEGDIAFFYFAGHGSQVQNSLSAEPDKLDESIVPADSRAGARDIRDKELRTYFNRVLDRGARLTIILDNCHSGSGARGLATGARPRGIKADARDAADATNGPRPEDRGALVIAATQDADLAWETRDETGKMHGAFSWAWIRAMRDAAPGEPAIETFLRAQARLRNETPYQEPAIAGTAAARLSPFLGARTDRTGERAIVAVTKVRNDGTVVLQGGWANGLSAGSELRVLSDREIAVRLRVTAMLGLGQSEARVEPGGVLPPAVRSGALLEIVAWAAPEGRPLRVWTPRVPGSIANIHLFARKLATEARKRGIRLLPDPVEKTPDYLLRRGSTGWELLGAAGQPQPLGGEAGAIAAVARIPSKSSLFIQLPAPAALVEGIGIGPGTDRAGIDPVALAEDADYVLAGRLSPAQTIEYAWIRPLTRNDDRRKSGLPARTAWVPEDGRDRTLRDSVAALRVAALRLRRVHAWHLLESPPRARYPYRLAVKRSERNGEVIRDAALTGGEQYDLVLRPASSPLPPHVSPRYVYVFTIDSNGKSVLLYPRESGSVENRLPRSAPPPGEMPLASFVVEPPYGVDTYLLLTTDEPLPNPWILEGDGVRDGGRRPSALEQLLLLTGSSERGRSIVTPSGWSLERSVFEAVAPRKKR